MTRKKQLADASEGKSRAEKSSGSTLNDDGRDAVTDTAPERGYNAPKRYLPTDKQDDQREFGKRIEAYRRGCDLTIEQLSRVTRAIDPDGSGISASSLSRYERGETMPSVRELKLLSFSFRAPLAALCYGSDDDPFKWQPDLTQVVQGIVLDMLAKNKLLHEDQGIGGTDENAHEALLTSIRAK